ncbi:MAG: thiol:disulfide interchange protein DsbA/DsbL [Gammaproteobacteria bacterium]|nr:thiol:disulfide interchange protein DsbA/DsbL [Gammaproteobacteria bacterium]
MNSDKIIQLLVSLAAVIFVVACSKQEPAAVEEDPAAIVEDAVDDTVVDAAPDDEDETLDVIEESAAEPEETGDEEIILARAEEPAANITFKYQEGKHYHRLVPSQPTIGGADKIEVAEFFWYGCPHCYDLEPTINRWAAEAPANVRFVRVPAMWNDVLQVHAKLFYTEEVLVRNGSIVDAEGFRTAVFEEYHGRGNRLLSEPTIKRLFARYGVGDEDFDKTWSSFEVSQKLRVAADLARRYSIASVPAIVVNGKYRTGGSEAGSYPKMIEVIDELVIRESAR